MNKRLLTLFSSVLIASGFVVAPAQARESNKGMMMDMKMMDANKDGMVSRDEYMKHHGMMFDKMSKNKDMMDMKEMQSTMGRGHMDMKSDMKGDRMMKDQSMKSGDMMKDKPMKSGEMMKDKPMK